MSLKKIIIVAILLPILYFAFIIIRYIHYTENRYLTKKPIDINKHITLVLDKDIHHFVESTINIELANSIKSDDEEVARKMFPDKSIKVCLYHTDAPNKKYCEYSDKYFSSMSHGQAMSFSIYDIPMHTPFNRVDIDTSVPIKKAKIFWKNWRL